jgi:hypothetical protein
MHRLSLLILVVVGACAQNGTDGGILVTKNVAPGNACTFLGDTTEPFIPAGSLSTLGAAGYIFNPQMQSRITALPGEENERTIIVQGANVDLTVDPAISVDPAFTHFRAVFSAPLFPIVNGTQPVSDSSFQLIPPEVVDAIVAANPGAAQFPSDTNPAFATLIQATFQVDGLMSGEFVNSQPFNYAVTVGNSTGVTSLGNCPVMAGALNVGDSCNPFQDGLVDCCTSGTTLVCPAQTM